MAKRTRSNNTRLVSLCAVGRMKARLRPGAGTAGRNAPEAETEDLPGIGLSARQGGMAASDAAAQDTLKSPPPMQ